MFDFASIYEAASVDDAMQALQADPEALVIAGGTDVLIQVRSGKLAGSHLVSIQNLQKELSGVTCAPSGDVEIGALTTFRECASSEVIRGVIPVLGEAADTAGGPQLRAVGTLGGNVCNGIPSADTASTQMAFGAKLHVRGPHGERVIPIEEWYVSTGKTALQHGEILTKIVVPHAHYEGWTGHFIKYATRNSMDISTLNVSCLVRLSADKKVVEDLRLAFGVAGPTPLRCCRTEEHLRGCTVPEAQERIGAEALAEIRPRDSWRASKAFRLQLAEELSRRALAEAARKGGAVW